MSKILASLNDGVRTIKFNRPEKKNAMNKSMFIEITNILNSDAKDDNIKVTILTGVGDFFSAGNDFVASMVEYEDTKSKDEVIYNYIEAFVAYPKLIVAIVNGPSYGVATTTLGLCDVVYATDNATFTTPFSKLAICAESCSSLTFPYIMGRSRASEMLILGRTLTAREAQQCGFVSEVVPFNKLDELIEQVHSYKKLPLISLTTTKRLIVNNFKSQLLDVAKKELEGLQVCFESEDFTIAMKNVFGNKKSKL